MSTKYSKTYAAIPPGETIREMIEDRQMTQNELACRMDLSVNYIRNLINGDVRLTQDVARRLEFALGMSSIFWLNLEKRYQNFLVKVDDENAKSIDSCRQLD